jgi:uncharacterized membrane protein YqhA
MKSNIEHQVMASVSVIYTARRLVSAPAIKLYVCALALFSLARLVWVSKVFENLSQVGLGNTLQFMLSAALNTDVLVQVALMALVVAGVSLTRDLVRSATATRTFAY